MTESEDPQADREAPELFRPRPGDDIVEPLFGALRGEDGTTDDDNAPRSGWRGALWWRLRLLFRPGR